MAKITISKNKTSCQNANGKQLKNILMFGDYRLEIKMYGNWLFLKKGGKKRRRKK